VYLLNLNLNLNLNLEPQILHLPRNQTENGELLRLPGSLSSGSGAEDEGLSPHSRSERRNSSVFDEGKLSE